ncbi:transposase-like protein [Salirhabdus euzebyi]|uniref:Transposase-like protein n=1 Tax=Salirhabdus euzebyi TaxID=394506 RepID=A0A841Q921_9BACI|nr:transposase-like protein [Salirhabdus euzebyi]
MGRFTSTEKHIAVQRYLKGNISYRDLAKEMGIDQSVLRYWVKLYEYHGNAAFIFPYTNYPLDFKLRVIKFLEETKHSLREASAIFHIPDYSMVRRWKKKWEMGGFDALKPTGERNPIMTTHNKNNTKKESPTTDSMEKMQKELEFLRMENAYLKKLNALVQNKEKSPKKTKRK